MSLMSAAEDELSKIVASANPRALQKEQALAAATKEAAELELQQCTKNRDSHQELNSETLQKGKTKQHTV